MQTSNRCCSGSSNRTAINAEVSITISSLAVRFRRNPVFHQPNECLGPEVLHIFSCSIQFVGQRYTIVVSLDSFEPFAKRALDGLGCTLARLLRHLANQSFDF